MEVRKKKIYTANQYLPPLNIPENISSIQTEEGNYYGALESGDGILPTEWVVTDDLGEQKIYTNEAFQTDFEEITE